MVVCPVCEHENLVGTLVCQACGSSLTGQAVKFETQDFDSDTFDFEIRESAGTTSFSALSVLRIEIAGLDPIVVHPAPNTDVTLGRRDPERGIMPSVDLSPLAAYRMGVSRMHARIHAENEHLYLRDLDSSNGTFLNGQRLAPGQSLILHNGDEVRLGRMVMRLYFR